MFDLAILGGGPAGYTAAERAGAAGLKVILFEKNQLGGVCLNCGCIPTKTILYSTKLYYNAMNGAKYGIKSEGVSFEYDKIVARKNKVVRKLVAGIRAKMSNHDVTVVTGEGSVKSNDGKNIIIECNGENYEAAKLLICTGSETMIPPIPGLDSASYWTSTEALDSKVVPESIVIIGGGVIGMEFAGIYSTLGCKVTVVEMAAEILPGVDQEIAAMLRNEFAKKGIVFNLSSKVTKIETNAVTYEDAEGEHRVETAQVLLSVGRKPVKKGIEALNLEPFRNGIQVNEKMQTSAENIYAAGDITAFSLLAHTAVREAEVAVNNMIGKKDAMSYKAIPGVIYTNPEVAGIGETEESMNQKGLQYHAMKLPMTFSGRFVAENEGGNGLCKIIVDSSEKVVGLHFIGNPSSEMISTGAVAIEAGMTVEQLKKVVFPHPTVSEIIKETLFEE